MSGRATTLTAAEMAEVAIGMQRNAGLNSGVEELAAEIKKGHVKGFIAMVKGSAEEGCDMQFIGCGLTPEEAVFLAQSLIHEAMSGGLSRGE